MLLTVDSESKKIFASIQAGDRMEKYECEISACENPTCTCGITYFDLIPARIENENTEPVPPRKVRLNIDKRSLEYKNKRNVPKEDLEFAKGFLHQLDENDFRIIHKAHFEFKNKITEETDLDSLDAYFDYDEVEYNGLMYAYNDVLPYGDQLYVIVDGRKCLIIDQFCLLPHCSCTDTILNIFSIDKVGKTGKELCVLSLKYKKKQWKTLEQFSSNINLTTSKAAILAQIPNLYAQLKKRHVKLKAIYAHCKKKHYSPDQKLEMPKVGRNDPCPCGSGKKYKKCCLNK
ncbi:MAG: SEC-C metal-binding domain-containing protein [Thermodesulfobacteriota bacterium]|nr:SEC-C metal-binding domain-containing protein [Thermodesulfobacteriota bacterium]